MREGKYSRKYYLHTLLLPKASSQGPVDLTWQRKGFTGASDGVASDQKQLTFVLQLPTPNAPLLHSFWIKL